MRVALVAAVVAGAVHAALARQSMFRGIDGPLLVQQVAAGETAHPYNLAYLPLARALHVALEPLGATPYWSAVALSVLGGVLAVFFVALAFERLGMRGRDVALSSALFALCPGVALWVTTPEHHGPFLAFAGAAVWWTVELVRRPSVPLAVGLGVATHVAFLVHGTGNLLPAWLLPWFLALRARRARDAGQANDTWRRDLRLAAVAGGVHVGLWLVVTPLALPALLRFGPGGIGFVTQSVGDAVSWSVVGRAFVQELVLPFAPLSVLVFGAFTRPAWRGEAIAWAVGAVPFLAVCVLLLGGVDESGAYLLPLAIGAARLAVGALGPLPAWVALVALVGWNLDRALAETPERTRSRAWSSEYVALRSERAGDVVLIGAREVGYVLRDAPGADYRVVTDFAASGAVDDPKPGLMRVDALLIALAGGGDDGLVVTDDAKATLRAPDIRMPFGVLLLEHLDATAASERVERGALRATRYRRRP